MRSEETKRLYGLQNTHYISGRTEVTWSASQQYQSANLNLKSCFKRNTHTNPSSSAPPFSTISISQLVKHWANSDKSSKLWKSTSSQNGKGLLYYIWSGVTHWHRNRFQMLSVTPREKGNIHSYFLYNFCNVACHSNLKTDTWLQSIYCTLLEIPYFTKLERTS